MQPSSTARSLQKNPFLLNIARRWLGLPIQAKLFLVVGFIFGTLFVFISHPMQAPDEPAHFWRAYAVSEGNVIAEKFEGDRYGYKLPEDIITLGETFSLLQDRRQIINLDLFRRYAKKPQNNAKRPVYFENSAVYSPVGYAPQAIGIGAARILKLPALQTFYTARFANLFTFLFLVTVAITLSPFGKWILATVSLLPMTLFEAASLSPDGLLFGLCCLSIAYLFFLLQKQYVKSGLLVIAITLSVAIALIKPPYSVLGYLFLLLPRVKFTKTVSYVLFVAFMVSLPLLTAGLWSAAANDIAKGIATQFRPGEHINALEQIRYIALHPLRYMWSMLSTVGYTQSISLGQGIIGVLGWFKIALPFYVYVVALLMLYYAIFKDKVNGYGRLSINRFIVGGMVLIGCFTAILVITSLYLTFTAVGASTVSGLQGRYFTPLLYLFLPALAYILPSQRYQKSRAAWKLYAIGMSFILLASLATLYAVNYQGIWPA